MFGEKRVILLAAEQIRGEIVGRQEAGEIVPDERAVADEGRGVGAIFARLTLDQFGSGSPLDVAMQFRLEHHVPPPIDSACRGRSSRAGTIASTWSMGYGPAGFCRE